MVLEDAATNAVFDELQVESVGDAVAVDVGWVLEPVVDIFDVDASVVVDIVGLEVCAGKRVADDDVVPTEGGDCGVGGFGPGQAAEDEISHERVGLSGTEGEGLPAVAKAEGPACGDEVSDLFLIESRAERAEGASVETFERVEDGSGEVIETLGEGVVGANACAVVGGVAVV